MSARPSRNVVYRDLDLNFNIHPNTKKLNVLSGDIVVLRALKNLILTDFYERPFHPEIGCNLRALLFENIMPSTAKNIKNVIIESIQNFEPRVQLNEVTVEAIPEKNGYNVILEYFILNNSSPKISNFFLERIR